MLNVTVAKDEITNEALIVWNKCLKKIKDTLAPNTYNTWFLPIKPVDFSDNILKLKVPNQFFFEWIDQHYKVIIQTTFKDIIGDGGRINFIISDEPIELEEVKETRPIIPIAKPIPLQNKPAEVQQSFLNPKYTFDHFIKGESNQLARAAALAIAKNPGETSFNPFFVYGGVGLGKTHLIQAIGNEVISKLPQKRVKYISTDQFTVDFVNAITQNKPNDFTESYKDIDVLILDDIQYLIGKEKTQDLFFRIFNSLHQAKKQIILSSDKPPKDLRGLDERLVSRFNWGLTADIQPPEFETRLAILRKKAEMFNLSLANHIIEYIASQITSNIRELEGCLIKLLAFASINDEELSLDIVKKIVRDISTAIKIPVSIDSITKITCEYLKVDPNKVRDKTRKHEIVFARQLCMYLAKDLTNSSFKTIGLHFGGRDHSTVIHACTSVEEMLLTDMSIKDTLDSIKNKIELECL